MEPSFSSGDSRSCRIIHDEKTEKTDKRGGHHVAQQIARTCRAAVIEKGIALQAVKLADISVPGVADKKTGSVHLATNIANLDSIYFQSYLRTAIGINVHLENDSNLAIRGRHWSGCWSGIDDIDFISGNGNLFWQNGWQKNA